MKKIIIDFALIYNVSQAAICQVNLTVQDHIDKNPVDAICDIPTSEFCTLCTAVMDANDLPGADIITLPGNATVCLSLTEFHENSAATGDLDITNTIAIGVSDEDMAGESSAGGACYRLNTHFLPTLQVMNF